MEKNVPTISKIVVRNHNHGKKKICIFFYKFYSIIAEHDTIRDNDQFIDKLEQYIDPLMLREFKQSGNNWTGDACYTMLFYLWKRVSHNDDQNTPQKGISSLTHSCDYSNSQMNSVEQYDDQHGTLIESNAISQSSVDICVQLPELRFIDQNDNTNTMTLMKQTSNLTSLYEVK